MRNCAAPAGRGSEKKNFQRWAHSARTVLLFLAAAIFAPGAEAKAGAHQRELQPVAIRQVPELSLTDLHGSRRDLAEFAGKVVLVHFFATWCAPCLPELTSLKGLVARDENRNLSVLAVSVGEPPVRLQRFFEKNPANFPVVLDADRAAAKAWGVAALPATFVLDRKGQARLHVEGDVDWLRTDVLARLQELGAEER